MPIYLLLLTEPRRLQPLRSQWFFPDMPPPFKVSFGPLLQEYRLLPGVHFPLTEKNNTGDHWNTTRPLVMLAAEWTVSTRARASYHSIIRTL